jgi:hypothetical protein
MSLVTAEKMVDTATLPRAWWPAGAASAVSVRYRTGRPGGRREATGSIFLPDIPVHDGSVRIAGYFHGATGRASGGAPSQAGLSEPERTHLGLWLAAGYVVAVPDIEHQPDGQPAPLYLPPADAPDMPDLVRAAHALSGAERAAWVAVGFSKGGLTALRTGSRTAEGAARLRFLGTVALAPTVSILGMVEAATARDDTRVHPAALGMLTGYAAEDPDLLAGLLSPAGDDLLRWSRTATIKELIERTEGITNGDAGLTRITGSPRVHAALAAAEAPARRFRRPVFLAASPTDTLLPYAHPAGYAARLAEAGTEVWWCGHHETSHLGILEQPTADALAWTPLLSSEDVT